MSGPFSVGDIVEPNWYPGDEVTVLDVGKDWFGWDNHVEQVIIIMFDGRRVRMRSAHFDLVHTSPDSSTGSDQ